MAFAGGIISGYESNVIFDEGSEWAVVEADEFDRSFLHLSPEWLGITSIDPDHLDIYNDENDIRNAFVRLAKQVAGGNPVLVSESVPPGIIPGEVRYGYDAANDIRISSLGFSRGLHRVRVEGLFDNPAELRFSMPGLHNASNAVLAAWLCHRAGCTQEEISDGLQSFPGVKRRFEYIIRKPDLVYIDDYAHHPSEINALIDAVKNIYPGKKITGIFQPHLFSRTRDFADEFAKSLSRLDRLYLLEIYPAREKPLPGIDAEFLFDKVRLNQKSIVDKQNLPVLIAENKPEILLTIGAGDIGQMVPVVKQALIRNYG